MLLDQILFGTFAVFVCANMCMCRKFHIEFLGMFTVCLQTYLQKHSCSKFGKCKDKYRLFMDAMFLF
jgi:hypothetical protein